MFACLFIYLISSDYFNGHKSRITEKYTVDSPVWFQSWNLKELRKGTTRSGAAA